ncbi:MAG: type II CRISPR-associated endonuclease Cas1 [Desulfovibrionaceae bacterium]
MSWRGIHVSEAARMCLKQNRLCVEQAGGEQSLALEDIAFIVLDSPQVTLTSALLAACADKGCLIITTDQRHMPNGSLLPFHPFYRQAETLQAQIQLTEPRKKRLWQYMIIAKINNQALCLRLAHGSASTEKRIACLAQKVRSGDPDNTEAQAARLYWRALVHNFKRDTEGEDRLNALFNYGYALLRAAIARELAACGFAPCLGVHHRSMLNAFNLADDMIEPWRPFVDYLALRHWQQDPNKKVLDTQDRRAMVHIFYEQVYFDTGEHTLLAALKKYMEQFRPYYLAARNDIICPCFPLHTVGNSVCPKRLSDSCD